MRQTSERQNHAENQEKNRSLKQNKTKKLCSSFQLLFSSKEPFITYSEVTCELPVNCSLLHEVGDSSAVCQRKYGCGDAPAQPSLPET